MNRAAVIVVNFGASALIEANLGRLGQIDDVEIVVVDCLSSEEERVRLTQVGDRLGWRVVPLPANLGFGGGMNAGADAAIRTGADVLVALNPDASLDEPALRALIDAAAANSDALVWPRIVTGDGSPWFVGADLYLDDGFVAGVGRRERLPRRRRVPWVTGACFALSTELWRRTGGFDEDFFLYWEDVDFSFRVQQLGGRLLAVDATVVHDEGQTHRGGTSARAKSEIYYYYNIRNRLLFARRHLSKRAKWQWLRATLRVSLGILLQGGRRQFLEGVRPWRASTQGVWDGLRGTVGAGGPTKRTDRPVVHGARRARLYNEVRTAHLERAREFTPATMVYLQRRYDFDDSLAVGLDLVQTSPLGAVRVLRTMKLETLELNEPLMLHGALVNAAAVLAVKVGRRRSARVVTYAIENTNTFQHRGDTWRSRLKHRAQVSAARYLWTQLDAVAYGTQAARETYEEVLGAPPRAEQRVIPALPAPRSDVDRGDRGATVVFLGAFVARKGFPLLLEAWPMVLRQRPQARLTLLGKGALASQATEFADSDASVAVHLDPPRDEIRAVLGRSRVLVLPSQPMPTWREQVGLPIVEGLESGCVVVTTAETGLAGWLDTHGHRIIPGGGEANALAAAIVAELDGANRVDEVLAALPEVDGRRAADTWLFGRDMTAAE